MGSENEATPGWKQEADDKMKELQSRVPVNIPKDVKGRPLTGKPTRLSKQVAKVNLGFDNTPAWNPDILMDDIHQDYLVNVANIIDAKARPSFDSYLITQVMPTLTKRYSDLMNSCMHHEMDITKNLDIAPMTRVEAEKNREILDKTTEAVIRHLRKHGINNVGELESKWKSARNWLVDVLNVLPSGEGVYGKV